MMYEKKYRNLLGEIIKSGSFREDRTGVGTKALFNQQLKIDLLATKKNEKIIKRKIPRISRY